MEQITEKTPQEGIAQLKELQEGLGTVMANHRHISDFLLLTKLSFSFATGTATTPESQKWQENFEQVTTHMDSISAALRGYYELIQSLKQELMREQEKGEMSVE